MLPSVKAVDVLFEVRIPYDGDTLKSWSNEGICIVKRINAEN